MKGKQIIRKTLAGLAVGATALACLACGGGDNSTSTASVRLAPVNLVLVQDSMGSNSPKEPRLTGDDLNSAVELIKARGGDLALVVNGADKVARLQLEPVPTQCVKTGRDYDDADCARKYNSDLAAWKKTTGDRVGTFMSSATALLAQTSQQDLDVWPALSSADLVLSEVATTDGPPAQKTLILVSTRDTRNNLCRDVYTHRTVPQGTKISDSFGGSYTCCYGEWYASPSLAPTNPCASSPTAPAQTAVEVVGPLRSKGVQLVVVKDSTALTPLEDFHATPFASFFKALDYVAKNKK